MLALSLLVFGRVMKPQSRAPIIKLIANLGYCIMYYCMYNVGIIHRRTWSLHVVRSKRGRKFLDGLQMLNDASNDDRKVVLLTDLVVSCVMIVCFRPLLHGY